MQTDMQSAIQQLTARLPGPFWKDAGFWTSLGVGVAGLIFSILAWIEAKRAKVAAFAAGRTVKLQTVAIELSEIGQRLDRVQPGIRFSEARDLLADTSRRVHRATSPFAREEVLNGSITAALQAVSEAQSALKAVRPEPGGEEQAPDAVYYGIEAACTQISACVADLIGLFEKQTFNFGEENAAS
jgi:hypothetical protein